MLLRGSFLELSYQIGNEKAQLQEQRQNQKNRWTVRISDVNEKSYSKSKIRHVPQGKFVLEFCVQSQLRRQTTFINHSLIE
jgi:hypothetical protein